MNGIIKIFIAILAVVLNACNGQGEIQPLTESWEIAIPNQEVPEGLQSLSAEDCGVCHQEHYQEWRLSTHSHAWTDLQFQAELKKESSPFMCINCHIPLQNQQEYIITGLLDGDIYQPVKKLNPKFDKDLQQEGINCAACHIRDNAVIGPTGTDKAPHKTIKDPEFLSETLCLSCHNATQVVTPTLVCTFETGDEWKSGPYYGQQNCISCHMDTITREIVPGFGERKSHRHFFSGSGIPKFDTVQTTMLNGFGFYPMEVQSEYGSKDSIKLDFKVINENAGHNVPSGDPERFFIIRMNIKDESNHVLKKMEFRIGEEWQWDPVAKKLSDNNFLPKEERTYTISFLAPSSGVYSWEILVEKHRLNQSSADYNELDSSYPLFITIYNVQYPIKVK